MARPNLQSLPEELVSNISLRLWSDDIQSLRLTCRALEQKTLHEWAMEYFSEKGFIVATDSLKVLLNIANSPKLRGFLRHVHILTAYFSESAFKCSKTCPHGHCCGWNPTVRQREAWNYFCDDQNSLKRTSRDKQMLTEALKRLPALTDIALVDTTASIPVEIDIRMLRKVPRLCGRNFMMPSETKDEPEYYDVLSHVWSVLTTSVANSGINTLKGFSTGLGRGSNPLCVPLDIRFSDTKIHRLTEVFSNLERFRIQFTLRPGRGTGRPKKRIAQTGVERVRKLAATLPALKALSMDFDAALTDSTIFTTFVSHLDLSKMTRLQLNTLMTDKAALVMTLGRLSAAKEVFFSFIDISQGSWVPVLKQLQSMDTLNHLHLMYCMQAGQKAYFLSQPDEDEQTDEDAMFYDYIMNGPGDHFEDDNDESDDDLPLLETMDDEVVSRAHQSTESLSASVKDDDTPPSLEPSSQAASTPAGPDSSVIGLTSSDSQPPKPDPTDLHASSDHKAPGQESYPDRGYYVCLRGNENIKKHLEIFKREYNLGESAHGVGDHPATAAAAMMGGMAIPIPMGDAGGPPGGMGGLQGGLAGYLGLPPIPGPHGGGAGVGQGGHDDGVQAGGPSTTGGLQSTAAAANNNSTQAVGGNAAGPVGGTVPLNSMDSLTGPSPPGAAGGGAIDDGWDTDSSTES